MRGKFNLYFIFSSISYFFMAAKPNLVSIMTFCIMGLMIGIMFSEGWKSTMRNISKIEKFALMAVSAWICISTVSYCMDNGLLQYILSDLMGHGFSNYSVGLCITGMILGTISFNFVYFLCGYLISWIIRFFKVIPVKRICSVIFFKNSLKKYMRCTLIAFINIVVASALGICTLFMVFGLPVNKIEKNVKLSAATIREEDVHPNVFSVVPQRAG